MVNFNYCFLTGIEKTESGCFCGIKKGESQNRVVWCKRLNERGNTLKVSCHSLHVVVVQAKKEEQLLKRRNISIEPEASPLSDCNGKARVTINVTYRC